MTTELVFIIDASGSMYDRVSDTIGGFNSLIDKQRKESGKALVSTVLFNSDSKVIHDRADLDRVEPMTEELYVPGGNTALLDAVGRSVKHIGNIHKYARKEDVPEKTMFVIITDGMENASREYTQEKVKKMIEKKKSKHGWEFVFLGSNIDAVSTAGKIGIDEENSVNYFDDMLTACYESVSAKLSGFRSSDYCSSEVSWRKQLDDEFNSRM